MNLGIVEMVDSEIEHVCGGDLMEDIYQAGVAAGKAANHFVHGLIDGLSGN